MLVLILGDEDAHQQVLFGKGYVYTITCSCRKNSFGVIVSVTECWRSELGQDTPSRYLARLEHL